MRFEVSERIQTGVNREEILNSLEGQFKKSSTRVKRNGDSITAYMIDATFGSINRSDKTVIEIKENENGFLITGDVNYRPSTMFWILNILMLFFFFPGMAIPIGFYFYHKGLITARIEKIFSRIKNEYENSTESTKSKNTDIDQLEKLMELKGKGILNEDEFQLKKQEILNIK